MLVSVEAQKVGGGDAEWSSGFNGRYKIPESRLAIARQLAWPKNDDTLPNLDRPNYNVFAALWGDSNEDIRRLSNAIFHLRKLARSKYNQSVAVFTAGTPELLAEEIEVQIGELVAGYTRGTDAGPLYYRFLPGQRQLPEEYPSGVGLVFSVGLNVARSIQRVRVHANGQSESSRFVGDHLDVFRGAVSLNGDHDDYESTRTLTERHIVIGNADVNHLVRRLSGIDLGTARQDFTAAGFNPDQPMGDLTNIFIPHERPA